MCIQRLFKNLIIFPPSQWFAWAWFEDIENRGTSKLTDRNSVSAGEGKARLSVSCSLRGLLPGCCQFCSFLVQLLLCSSFPFLLSPPTQPPPCPAFPTQHTFLLLKASTKRVFTQWLESAYKHSKWRFNVLVSEVMPMSFDKSLHHFAYGYISTTQRQVAPGHLINNDRTFGVLSALSQ